MPSSGPVGRTCASSTARLECPVGPSTAPLSPAWRRDSVRPLSGATPYCITHALIRAVEGDWEEGLFFCGAEVGQVNEMSTVAQVLAEYQAALAQR